MAELLFPNVIRALDANGDPVEGAELRAYRSGTTTALTLYSDTSGATAIAVPLVADSDGVFAMPIYNTSAFAAKIDVVDPVTSVSLPGYPIDPVLAGVDDNIAASDVTFAATTDITSTNVQDAIEEVDNHWRAAKTGIDDDIVSGTAGTDGNLAQWNADGDLVNGPDVLDEDDMASDSASAVPTQQSVKAYVDAATASGPVSGRTLLGTLDTATGTPSSVTLSSLTLTDYTELLCVFDGVSGNGGVSKNLQLEGQVIGASFGDNTVSGLVQIDLADGAASAVLGALGARGVATSLTTSSTSITFAVTAGTFDAGTIKVYGRT
jgi:hypothetical protein